MSSPKDSNPPCSQDTKTVVRGAYQAAHFQTTTNGSQDVRGGQAVMLVMLYRRSWSGLHQKLRIWAKSKTCPKHSCTETKQKAVVVHDKEYKEIHNLCKQHQQIYKIKQRQQGVYPSVSPIPAHHPSRWIRLVVPPLPRQAMALSPSRPWRIEAKVSGNRFDVWIFGRDEDEILVRILVQWYFR